MKATLEDLERELWLRNRNSGSIVWITKDGREIPINEMSDEHLKNTINMIMRVRDSRDCYERITDKPGIIPIQSHEIMPRNLEYDDWFWENLFD